MNGHSDSDPQQANLLHGIRYRLHLSFASRDRREKKRKRRDLPTGSSTDYDGSIAIQNEVCFRGIMPLYLTLLLLESR